MRTSLIAFACAVLAFSTPATAAKFTFASQTLHERSAPDVDVEAEADIGEPVVLTQRFLAAPAMRLRAPIESGSAMGNKIRLAPGVYSLWGSTPQGSYYKAPGPISLYALGLAMQWPDGGVYIPADPNSPPGAYWVNGYGGKIEGKVSAMPVEPVPEAELTGSGYRRELVYTGVSAGVVSLVYREFVNDLARPAFTQALTYNLSEGDEIGYRGARLKVLKATNTSIRYILLKPLGGE